MALGGKYVVQGGRQGSDDMIEVSANSRAFITLPSTLSEDGATPAVPAPTATRLRAADRFAHSFATLGRNVSRTRSADAAGRTAFGGGGGRRGGGGRVVPRGDLATNTWPEACAQPLPDLRYLMREADAACAEVRLTFAFTPSGHEAGYRMALPTIAPSECNIVFTDNRTQVSSYMCLQPHYPQHSVKIWDALT